MTFDYFIPRFAAWLAFLANAFVFAAAVNYYRQRAMRSVLLIAVSAGLGAALAVISWVAQTPAPAFWHAIDLLGAVELVLYAIGVCLLFREFSAHEHRSS